MDFVADTPALRWYFINSPKLSSKASEIFESCERGECIIFIPSIVIAEALSIFEKKKISFDFKKLLKKLYESENFVIIPLDYSVLHKMGDLKDISELHDKIVVSTANYLNLPIITKDKALRNIQHIKAIW